MKLLFMFILLILCWTHVFSSNIGEDENSLNHRDSKYAQLIDLDMDSQWLILEDLPLVDLITMAEVNRLLSYLVSNILRMRFGQKIVIFGSPYYTSRSKQRTYVQETADFISIHSFPIASKLLHYFGHFVQKIKIDDYFLDQRTNAIIKMVTSGCAETLNEIWLRNAKADFNDFSKPFERVQKVQLDGDLRNIADLSMRLNELFPAMTHLILNLVKFDDTKSIELEYSNLERLEVDIFDKMIPGRVTEDVVANIIRKNHQIKSIVLKNASEKLQLFIRKQLPNLMELELVEDDDEDDYDDFYEEEV